MELDTGFRGEPSSVYREVSSNFFEVSKIRVRFRRLLFAALAAAALSLPVCGLHAQVTATASTPANEQPNYSDRWDVFGGAQYSHFNPAPGTGVHAINLMGWNATLDAWLRPRFALEATTRNLSGTIVPPLNAYGIKNYSMSEHLFLFGPAVRFIARPRYDAGMHLAVGAAYGIFDNGYPPNVMPSNLGIYNTKLALGLAVGGFADYHVTPRWAVRVYTDWQPTHYGYTRQDEFAGAVGIVYKFGGHTR